MRDTNYDVAEAGVGARGGAAQGAGPRQDDGGHRHPRSQLDNILHFALNSLLWNFLHDINNAGYQAWCRPSVTRGTAACTSSSTPSAGRWRQPTLTRKRSLRRTQRMVTISCFKFDITTITSINTQLLEKMPTCTSPYYN